MNNIVPVIAITGGPCGGKSTFLARVSQWFQEYGILPFVISETATELINAGITPSLIGMEDFEGAIINYQLQREDLYFSIVKKIANKHPVVILCDRGVMDCAAYIEKKIFDRIIGNFGYSNKNPMDRYNLVVHLTTAALGAEEFYTLQNNIARKENVEEARILDERTRQAWLGHPHHIVIDNQTGFDEKMLHAIQSLARTLNMPKPTEIERKFKVLNFHPDLIPSDSAVVKITQDYLKGDEEKERRVRIYELYGQKSFFYTEKIETDIIGIRYELEKLIDYEAYLQFYAERDENFNTIKKTRYCFFYKNKKFELDVYNDLFEGELLVVMEVELKDINEKIELPPWLKLEEITGIKKYKNINIAKK